MESWNALLYYYESHIESAAPPCSSQIIDLQRAGAESVDAFISRLDQLVSILSSLNAAAVSVLTKQLLRGAPSSTSSTSSLISDY
jgi:hypothetical protein